MADNITRCPECATAFRISDAHLKSAKGVVRCGSCLALFNARDHLEVRTPKPQDPGHSAPPANSHVPSRSTSTPASGTPERARAAVSPGSRFETDSASKPSSARAQQDTATPSPRQAGPEGIERRRMPRATEQQTWFEPKPYAFPSERPVYEEPRFTEPAFEYPDAEDSETDDHEVDDDEAWALELLKDDDSELNVQFKKVVPVVSSAEPDTSAVNLEQPIQALDEELDQLLGEDLEPDATAPSLPEAPATAQQVSDAPLEQDTSPRIKRPSSEIAQAPDTFEAHSSEKPTESASATVEQPPRKATEQPSSAALQEQATPAPEAETESFRALPEDPSPKPRAKPARAVSLQDEPATGLTKKFTQEALEQSPVTSAVEPQPGVEPDQSGLPETSTDEPPAPQPGSAGATRPPAATPAPKGQPLDRATLKNMLAAIEPDPMEVEFPQDQQVWYKRLMWPGLMLGAALVLTIQVAWLEFDRLSRIEPYRSFYGVACRLINCELPELKDRSLIQTSNLVVRSHPELADTLAIDVILQNNAPFEQSFPTLQLTFTDLQGEPVAVRRFAPEQYLGGELAEQDQMPLRQPIHIAMEIVDPGPSAVNYNVIIVD